MRAAAGATGVARYGEAVLAALAESGRQPFVLDDAARGRFGEARGPADRARRMLAARLGHARALAYVGRWLRGRDVFRLAQARFDATGAMLRLRAPGAPGVMHWTYPIPARIEGWANLYTVHDVVPITHPALASVDPAKLRARLAAIVASGGRIATVSSASRAAIAGVTGVPADDILDCGSAVVALDRAGGPLPDGLAPGGYHLFCGMDEPRKNLPRIVAGWQASGARLPLVVAGPAGATAYPGVRTLGYLDRPVLMDVIAGARSLVFATLEEGFGLPAIEAMALGTPVIASARGALGEVAGGAALAVDPEDAGAIGAAIRAIEGDASLAALLAERGRRRAADFSLPAFGKRLLAAYAEIAGDLPPAA